MQASKRGKNVALYGLVLQCVLAALAAAMWHVTRSPASWPALWLVLAPLPLWLLTIILFYSRLLERREDQEMQELAGRGGDDASIFADGSDMRTAQRRLRWMERYLVGGFTILFALFHLGMGAALLYALRGVNNLGLDHGAAATWMFAAIGMAFVSFLFSRYAGGMARSDHYRLLRAPAGYLFVDALVFLLMAVALAAENYNSHVTDRLISFLFAGFLVLLGAEMLLNFILDIYRPRIPGQERRYSYDSRLLSLIAHPESIGHSIAEALNYQFGFEVSTTWFYKLLQRAMVPLVVLGAVLLWLLSSVVVVQEGEEYVVLHWGQRYPEKLLKPRSSPYFIWPWPIEKAMRFQTDQVQEILLGMGAARTDATAKRVYLWSEEHGSREELDTLVAIPPQKVATTQPGGMRSADEVPSVNLVKLTVGVYYRIVDPYLYGFTYADPHQMLEHIAAREMLEYAASATLDEELPGPEGAQRAAGLMSFGRNKAETDLCKRIEQAEAKLNEGKGLGVDIIRVEILGSHPPKDAADAFEGVAATERQSEQKRYAAQTGANKILAEAAGDPDLAWRLSQAIGIRNDIDRLANVGRTGEDAAALAAGMLTSCQSDIARQKAEIEKERLLGQISDNPQAPNGHMTITQQLLQRQEEYAKLLEETAAKRAPDLAAALTAAKRDVEQLFAASQGQAAVDVAQARAARWKQEFRERARVESFNVELLCMEAAPSLYRLEKYLQVLTDGVRSRRKYILGVDRDRVEVRVNLERPLPTFSDVLPDSK